VSDLIGVRTAVQDFRNKSLAPLQRQAVGQVANPAGRLEVPGPSLPGTVGGGGNYGARLEDTARAASDANSRLMSSIAQRSARLRQQQGRGTMGGATQAMVASGKGLGPAGGWGGAYGLQKNAAAALARMSAAYQARWGAPLVVNSGGRSYADQARLFALYKAGRGNLAAPPGTSVHESGRAVDLGGPIYRLGTPQHNWLQQVAGQYGFSWTGRTFSQIEPWHWEYVGS
jgi:hypothetical protein